MEDIKDTFFNFRCKDIDEELSEKYPSTWIYEEIYRELDDGPMTLSEHNRRREDWPMPRYFMSPEKADMVYKRLLELNSDSEKGLKFLTGYFKEFIINHKIFLQYFGPESYQGINVPYYNEVQKLRDPLYNMIKLITEAKTLDPRIIEKGNDLFIEILKEGSYSIEKIKENAERTIKKYENEIENAKIKIDECQKLVDKCNRSKNTTNKYIENTRELKKLL